MFSVVMKCLKPIVPLLQVSVLQVSKLKFRSLWLHKGQKEVVNIVKACRKECTEQLALQLQVLQDFKFNRNAIQV